MKKIIVGSLTGLFCLSTLPAAAATSIQFMLNGKAVNAVPVDQLGAVTVQVNGGGQSFKQLWSGQWQGIDQALNVVGTHYKKGQSAPGLDKSHNWDGYAITRTNVDANWGGQKSASMSMAKIASANGLRLFDATSEDEVVFTTRFRRQVYTGKMVWKDGKYVKETRWETAGPHQGQAVLKLMPPTFATSFKPDNVFAGSLQKLNKPPANKYANNDAMLLASTILNPPSVGGREDSFTGSKVLGFESTGEKAVFNWNYIDDDQFVYAQVPVKMKVHTVMITKFDNLPTPMTIEADFLCSIKLNSRRKIGASQWEGRDLTFNDEIRKTCRTPDGKTPEEVSKSVGNPVKNLVMPDKNKSPEEQARDILNQLGM